MALNIKNAEVERLAADLAIQTGESKTETIRKALEQRRRRLALRSTQRQRGSSFMSFLENEVWPSLPPATRGLRLTKEEEDELLGYGPEGV